MFRVRVRVVHAPQTSVCCCLLHCSGSFAACVPFWRTIYPSSGGCLVIISVELPTVFVGRQRTISSDVLDQKLWSILNLRALCATLNSFAAANARLSKRIYAWDTFFRSWMDETGNMPMAVVGAFPKVTHANGKHSREGSAVSTASTAADGTASAFVAAHSPASGSRGTEELSPNAPECACH
jgi:hypothetical protein